MSLHILEPAEGGPHRQHPDRETITEPALDPHFFAPLALLDLAFLDDALAGRKCLCLAMNVSTCDEYLRIGERDDGTWTVVDVDGMSPEDPSKGSKWAEPFESGPNGFDALPSYAAELTPAEPGSFAREERVELRLGEPAWVQSPDAPSGDDWRFVARLDSYHLFGSMFVFYSPSLRQAHHLIQFT